MKKTVLTYFAILCLLSTVSLTGLVSNTQAVEAGGTIYIRATGEVEGTDKIQRDGDIYTFTDNINDSIVVERDNIVIDGEEHLLQRPGMHAGSDVGINLSGRTNVTVENLQILDFYFGVKLSGAYNNTVSGNNMTNNEYGVYLLSPSYYNNVSGNHIADNHIAVYLEWSRNNIVSGNNMTNNEYGVYLAHSAYDKVLDNMFTNDGVFVVAPFQIIVEGNLVNGKPLIYLEDVSRYTVEDAGQVILVNCNDIRVENLNLTNTTVGIQLWKTHDSDITNNHIANNREGIYLVYCTRNTLSGNNIANNGRGVFLQSTPDIVNSFFHNNFINNGWQVYFFGVCTYTWDDGYPSGGNYWSDYASRYPNATELDDSGIWNMSYVIEGSNQDNYPLMTQYVAPQDMISPTISVLSPENKTYGGKDVSLAFIVSESTSWIGYSLDGQANVTISGNTTLSELSEGSHSLTVYAEDTTGNAGASEKIYFTVETQPSPFWMQWWFWVAVVLMALAIAGAAYFLKRR